MYTRRQIFFSLCARFHALCPCTFVSVLAELSQFRPVLICKYGSSVHICACLCMSVHVCACLCMSVHVCTFLCMLVHVCTFLCMSVHVCACLCMFVHVRACLYVSLHACACLYISVHVGACLCISRPCALHLGWAVARECHDCVCHITGSVCLTIFF